MSNFPFLLLHLHPEESPYFSLEGDRGQMSSRPVVANRWSEGSERLAAAVVNRDEHCQEAFCELPNQHRIKRPYIISET